MPTSDLSLSAEEIELRDKWRAAVGRAVRAVREQEELTQAGLAARSGLSRSTIVHLENGQQSILLDRLFPLLGPLRLRLTDFAELVTDEFERMNDD